MEENRDIVFLNLMIPHNSDLQAIDELRQTYPDSRILILKNLNGDNEMTMDRPRTPGKQFLDSPKEFLGYVRSCLSESYDQPDVVPDRELTQVEFPDFNERLTDRELEVLHKIAQGLSNQEIGQELFIGERTVRNHVSNILDKLHLANRTQAAIFALREGIISLDEI